jgi:hypothetical protein
MSKFVKKHGTGIRWTGAIVCDDRSPNPESQRMRPLAKQWEQPYKDKKLWPNRAARVGQAIDGDANN